MTEKLVLRDYQRPGAQRMLDRGRALVYVPQGGGKTVVAIHVTEQLREEFGPTFRSVIIAPGDGLKKQWEQAIRRWTGGTLLNPGTAKAHYVGGADVVLVKGTRKERSDSYARAAAHKSPYVIIGYSQVTGDYEKVKELDPDCQVGDEITAIGNPGSNRSQALKTLQSPFIYGMSGDPIENGQLIEIFSEMEWIDDTVLGRADLFDKAYVIRAKSRGFVVGYKNVPEFFERLEPALVRIREDDPRLARYMPTMGDPTQHLVSFDAESQGVYDLIAVDLVAELQAAMKYNSGFDVMAYYAGHDTQANAIQGRIASRIGAARMLCDDPDILLNSAEEWLDAGNQPLVTKTINGKKVTRPRTKPGSQYAASLMEEGHLDGLDRTPKKDLVDQRIKELLRQDETTKIIVFCFYKGFLRSLHRRHRDHSVLYHGDLNATAKADSIAAFRNDPKTRVFLSSDAGGYGLDLPEAQYLINADIPYSAGKSKQRDTRHRRASSEFEEVYVENYLIKDSLEVFYAARTMEKRRTSKGLLDGVHVDRKGRLEISAESLCAFLLSHLEIR